MEATAAIYSVYEEVALDARVCQRWFGKLSNNHFDLEDDQHSQKLGKTTFKL